MRQPLASPDPRSQIAETVSIPAPSGGLNARDSLLAMPPTDARILVNCIARPSHVEVRDGCADWVTGFTAAVETLMMYKPPSGTGEMFAACDDSIYDVTATGTVDTAVVGSLTSAKWQWVNFANSADSYLLAVNGADDLISYNGSAWSSTATLGTVDTNTLIDITVYQKRLFFVQKDSRLIHYLDAGAISGTAYTLNFEQHLKRGGYIQSIGSWSVDAGDGLDDVFVAVSSEGEVVVYTGTDPGDVGLWALRGVYYAGKPMGRRCLFQLGSELIIITDRGLYPLSRALSEGGSRRSSYLSDKINPLFTDYAEDGASAFGWQAAVSTSDNILLVNVPAAGTVQLVMDLTSGGWSVFKGWTAKCFLSFGDDLFYGMANKVVKALSGWKDFTKKVEAFISPAYLTFGKGPQQKHIKLFRPLFTSALPFTYKVGVSTDLESPGSLRTTIQTAVGELSLWDVGIWDEAIWGGLSLAREWHSVESSPGSFLSLYLRVEKTESYIHLHGIDYAVERGGVL